MFLACARPHFFVAAKAGPDPRPKQRKLRPRDVNLAITHAQNLCYNFEDTAACRVAWDHVEEISGALARQMEAELIRKNHEEICAEDPAACREYDL